MMCLLLGAVSFLPAVLCATEADDRERQKKIDYLFKMGTEYYYQGKYSQAIKFWEAVLDIDPQQTQPPALIENAREQIQKDTNPLQVKFEAAVRTGDYISAQELNLRLLDLDGTNKGYKPIMHKLKKIVKIFPVLPKNSKVARLVKQGVGGYILEPNDVELAFTSVRHARKSEPDNPSLVKFADLLAAAYPTEAKKHVELAGVDVLAQVLQKALNNIYEGKYVEAISACNQALKLDPDNLLAHKRLGSAYFALGNKKQAYAIWKKAQKIAPGDDELKKFLKIK